MQTFKNGNSLPPQSGIVMLLQRKGIAFGLLLGILVFAALLRIMSFHVCVR